MYFFIENDGKLPVDCIRLFGASLTRGTKGTIGMFGSGSKYAICLLIRQGLMPVIYSGEDEVSFSVKKLNIDDGVKSLNVHQVVMHVNGVAENTNLTLEHGVQDWADQDMAYRELVANALDMQYRLKQNYLIEWGTAKEPTPRPGKTVVYIPVDDIGRAYFTNIRSKFLHNTDKFDVPIFTNCSNKTMIYRSNVLTATYDKKALFCYNSNDFKLTESRTIDEIQSNYIVARLLSQHATEEDIGKLLFALHKGEDCCETKISTCYFSGKASTFAAKTKAAFKTVFGANACACSIYLADRITRKGYTPVTFDANWIKYFREIDILTEIDVLTKLEQKDKKVRNPKNVTVKVFDRCWARVKELGLDNGKDKPKLMIQEYAVDNVVVRGEYEDGVVYINKDIEGVSDELIMTILDELGHHCSGGNDISRDLQEWFLKLACKSLNLIEEMIS